MNTAQHEGVVDAGKRQSQPLLLLSHEVSNKAASRADLAKRLGTSESGARKGAQLMAVALAA